MTRYIKHTGISWKPWSELPKDGWGEILVRFDGSGYEHGKPFTDVAYLGRDCEGVIVTGPGDLAMSKGIQPTHWSPMPDPNEVAG